LRRLRSQHPRFALDLVHLRDRTLATFEPFLRDQPDDDRYLRALVVLRRGRVEAVASDLRWQVCHGDFHGGNTHRQTDGNLVFFEIGSAGPVTQQCARNRDVSIVSVCIRGRLTLTRLC
jgi:Ser/Thr protein kinase RdoA (MazF antagonist)